MARHAAFHLRLSEVEAHDRAHHWHVLILDSTAQSIGEHLLGRLEIGETSVAIH